MVSYKLDIFDRSIIIKILSKVYLGAVVVLVVLYASYLAGSSIILKVYVAFMTYMIFVSIFSGIRGAKITKICGTCPQWKKFPYCDGFREIIDRLSRDGFIECL